MPGECNESYSEEDDGGRFRNRFVLHVISIDASRDDNWVLVEVVPRLTAVELASILGCLNVRTQPRRADDVNRESGTECAISRSYSKFIRLFVQ